VTLKKGEFRRFYQTVKKASHENALTVARRKVVPKNDPFGRFLQLIRTKSELSKRDVAQLLNKDYSYIEKIENGQINPVNLPPPDVVDIMQLFKLTLSELVTGIKAFVSLSIVKKGKISGMARSSIKPGAEGKEDSLAHAMDAALQKIAEKNAQTQQDKTEIDPNYLEAVKEELEKRGEESLLV
jgi:transcriptional regulator with XRE-family HTH domain